MSAPPFPGNSLSTILSQATPTPNVPYRILPLPRAQRLARALKRGSDIAGAMTLLFILLPPLLILIFVVRLDGGPAFYRHTRVGLGGRPFRCVKFRTMVTAADQLLASHLATDAEAAREWSARRKLADDPRVTRIGKLLRATSLDELPQLLNVLRGEMSLVGPRPVVPEELQQHYGIQGETAYLATRPGITGLWQISGRSDTTYQQRVALDIRYVTEWSLLLDAMILLRTIPAVLARRGAM
ncbi:sugar transferase [Neoroseomonas rubea]|uniref:sugar transferase n=1 Tax=Neoroseomonas rubea TaxID=2748666 RepID=UPI0018DF1DAE|nr:sugar transferase [Roseomonas rubea]